MKHDELTELLAYRDGDTEALTSERQAELAADPGTPVKLARLAGLTQALRALPQQPPSPSVWLAVEARLKGRGDPVRRQKYRRHWAALAASICSIVLTAWLVSMRVDHGDESRVAELIDTSQLLERQWLARHDRDRDSVVREALLYRIASVDSQLNQINADGHARPADVQALWRKRVALLQSLLEVDQGERIQYTTL